MSEPLVSLEAERAVIGAVLIAGDLRHVAAALYVAEPSEYTDGRHVTVMHALRTLDERKAPLDLVTLRLELERVGKLSAVTDEWLADVTDTIPNTATVVEAAERVKLLAAARRRRAEHVAVAALYGAGRIDEAEDASAALMRSGTGTASRSRRMTFAEAAMGPYSRLLARAEGRAETGRRRVTSGIPALDRALRGLRSRSMLVIGARPSVGKSTLMLEMARGQARAGERPGYLSVEDDEDIGGSRLLASASGVPLRWVGDEDVSRIPDGGWEDLAGAMQSLHDAGGHFVVPYSPRVEVVCAEMRWLVREAGCTCLFVDYLQKLRARGEKMLDRTSNAAAAIEEEAESLDVPLVTASQLSRPERGSEHDEPPIERLRYTGDIEASADAILMAWYDRPASVEDERELIDPRPINIRVGKLKWGSPGALLRLRRAPSGALHEIDDEHDFAEAAQ